MWKFERSKCVINNLCLSGEYYEEEKKKKKKTKEIILYDNGVDKLRDHGRGHRRRGVLDAFGYSNEHVDVTTEREDDSKDDGRRLERGKHRGGGEERRGGNREEAEEVIVGLFV